MQLTPQFRQAVIAALLRVRPNFEGSDKAFAKKYGMNSSIWSRLKSGANPDGLLKDPILLNIGRELGVTPHERKWNMARTDVYDAIKGDVEFCKDYSKSMVLVDDCAIGKTFAGKYLARTLKNCFYVDASQCKTRQQFIRTLANVLGVEKDDKYINIKSTVKYYLRMIERPVIIIDEAGDLEYSTLLELKEMWNATDGTCGWYMMGADGLRRKIEKGVTAHKVGYAEIFSRFSNKFMKIVPVGNDDKKAFYQKLVTDVISVNIEDKSIVPTIVKRCLASDNLGEIGGLRRAETLLILNNAA